MSARGGTVTSSDPRWTAYKASTQLSWPGGRNASSGARTARRLLPEGRIAQGEGVELPSRRERAATKILTNGVPVAALIHDPVLLDEPDLIESVRAAAELVLESERLAAENCDAWSASSTTVRNGGCRDVAQTEPRARTPTRSSLRRWRWPRTTSSKPSRSCANSPEASARAELQLRWLRGAAAFMVSQRLPSTTQRSPYARLFDFNQSHGVSKRDVDRTRQGARHECRTSIRCP